MSARLRALRDELRSADPADAERIGDEIAKVERLLATRSAGHIEHRRSPC